MTIARRAFATVLVAASITPGVAAHAATFTVDRVSDGATATACDDEVASDCSLRGAILAANALAEPSTINVPAGTFVLSESSPCTYRVLTSTPGVFTSAQVTLCLSADITIRGAGADVTIIDGDQRGRVLFVSADAIAEVHGVTVRNGNGGPNFFASQGGGGIQNHGALTLVESVVRDNLLPPVISLGAGIENFGTLALRRCAVSNNGGSLGTGGGGIHNEGFFSSSQLSVSDSIVDGNRTAGFGGGIANGGTAIVVNSTIGGNVAENAFGGGVANLHAGGSFATRLTLINSTISGNTAGSLGGGIYNGTLTALHLNGVTIADNTANTDLFNRGGGGINNQGASDGVTLQNTIIAGNRDLGLAPAPDCFAEAGNGLPLTSRGYNLIQDVTHCTLVGDATGNLTGVDPLLGPLSDNGGRTRTHALASGSPALDAGNPAAPGSGGTACTALDQRGISRLQDGDGDSAGRCDIGAYELSESGVDLALSGMRPNAAGNGDVLYALIYGSGFAPGMTVGLMRPGESDIVADGVTVDPSSAVAAATLPVAGRTAGPWDVIVANPDGSTHSIPGGFTLATGGGPDIWSQVIGPPVIRVGRPARFSLLVGNRGNVDAHAVPVRIAVQRDIAVSLNFPITAPPFQVGQVRTDWSQTPLGVPTADGTTNIWLLLPLVPAGFTATLELVLTGAEGTAGRQFELRGVADPPLFAPGLDAQMVADAVAGARAYAEEAIGITIPAALATELDTYLRTQLARVVENGRDALVASTGAQLQVYSRAQLTVDLARFGAVLAGAQPPLPLARRGGDRDLNASMRAVASGERSTIADICSGVMSLIMPAMAHGQGGGVLPEGHSEPVGCGANGGAFQGCVKGDEVLGVTCCPLGMGSAACCGGGGPFTNVQGKDPNEKTGARGVGDAHFLPGPDSLHYAIAFENLATATAAAQEVVITDQLDPDLIDLDTFSLGPIAFGDHRVTPPPGLSRYSTSVDLRPAIDLLVSIDARLDKQTGIVTWRFLSIDPLTGQFTEDPVAGFLPPDVNPPEGDGSVQFSVRPTVVDTPICNEASIVFDVNEALVTPPWCNTIDTAPPVSRVLPLAPVQTDTSFLIEWEGSDSGAGVADFTIYMSEDGGAFVPLLSDTTETSTLFTGEDGRTYAFCSRSRDLVGTLETKACPPTADTSTTIAVTLPSASPTVTATEAPAPSPTGTPTATGTAASATVTATATHTVTTTPPPTSTTMPATRTATPTRTATRSATPTRTATRTATATPTPPPSPPTRCGDLDGDGRVTWLDAVIEALAVLLRRSEVRYDINRDGRVTAADLVSLAGQLGRVCRPG